MLWPTIVDVVDRQASKNQYDNYPPSHYRASKIINENLSVQSTDSTQPTMNVNCASKQQPQFLCVCVMISPNDADKEALAKLGES